MFMGLCQISDLKLYLQRNIDNYQPMLRIFKYLLYLSEMQYKIAWFCKLATNNSFIFTQNSGVRHW